MTRFFDLKLYIEGLKKLTNSVFSYPYAYETAEEAFTDALKRLRELI